MIIVFIIEASVQAPLAAFGTSKDAMVVIIRVTLKIPVKRLKQMVNFEASEVNSEVEPASKRQIDTVLVC